MARQRFIWPAMWTDKTFGSLTADEKVLFISLFSLADDEGRISGEPEFLKAQAFAYESYSVRKVAAIRDGVVAKMRNVRLYEANDEQFIALMQWAEYQKPKYPKPSRIPPPFPEDSRNVPGRLTERSSMGWVGLGRDGKGRAVDLKADDAREHDEQPSDESIGETVLRSLRGAA